MVIQERDREILRRCYEQQFLLVEHVARYFFRGAGADKARLRVIELERCGLIRKDKTSLLGGRRIIRLTQSGLKLIQADHHLNIPQSRKLDPETLTHDAIVSSVALRLSEIWSGTWIPERALKQQDYPQVPDGIFVFDNGTKVAIEVENSLKGRRRFLSLLERWRQINVLLVLYVATTEALYQTLKRYLGDGPKKPPFVLIFWNELKEGAPCAWSTQGELEIFNKKEL